MHVLGIILARGGSKGIPKKNLIKIGKDSLVKRAVNSGIKSKSIDNIAISTDCEKILEEAISAGRIEYIKRSSELSSDTASSIDALIDAIKAWEKMNAKNTDIVALLEPTSPFRTGLHVKSALQKFKTGKFKSVISVCPLERKPENIFKKKSNNLEKYIISPDEKFARRQDMNHLCRLNSAIYVAYRDDILIKKKLLIDPIGYIEMSEVESINIDTMLDVKVARILAEEKNF